MRHAGRWAKRSVIVAVVFCAFVASAVRGDCKLREAALDARRKADAAHAAYLQVQLDPKLDAKLNQFYAETGWLTDAADVDPSTLREARDAIFTQDEQNALRGYIKALQADRAADADARAAESAWLKEAIRKDDALKAAADRLAKE